jgi:hypothetical protein
MASFKQYLAIQSQLFTFEKKDMFPNLLIIAAAALIPFFIAFVWFHPKVFGGDTWTKIAGLSEEAGAKKVKPLKLILSILLNFLFGIGLYGMTIHQAGVSSLVGGNPENLKTGTGAAFMAEYGAGFLTFGHGALHGFIAAIFVVLPILGYATIFERKSGKYLMVNFGFWALSLILMGGVICKWGGVPIQ